MAICIQTTGNNIETDKVISFTAINFANGIPENGYEANVENASNEDIKKSLSGFLDYLKRSLWVSYNMPLTNAFVERESQKYDLDCKGIESLCALTYSPDDVLCQEFELEITGQFKSPREEALDAGKHYLLIQRND